MPRTTTRDDLISHPSAADASLGVSSSAVEPMYAADPVGVDPLSTTSVGWAGSPALLAAMCCAWVVVGCVIGDGLARRGHDRRAMTTLGVALGPLLGALAFGSARWRAATARPIIVDRGRHREGQRVMVAVGGSAEDVADVGSVLDLVGDGIGRIDLVAHVTIEDAVAGERSLTNSRTAERAVGALRGAASFMPDHDPGLILVAGPPRTALADYAVDRGYDLVVATGSERHRETFGRAFRRSGAAPLFVAPGPTDRSPDRSHRP